MDKLLPATADCMFKSLMLDPSLLSVLKELISLITGIPYDTLENIKVENTEYLKDNKKDKKMTSDIVVSVGNKHINVEMNAYYYRGVFNKNDAYLTKLKATTYNSNESYLSAFQVIQINFNNFDNFEHKKDIYKFMFMEVDTHELDYDSTIKYHVSLENIWNRCYNKDVNELTRLERFCMLLKTDDKEYAKLLGSGDEVMESLIDKMNKLSLDSKMIGVYDREVEEEKIKKTRLEGARLEGLEQGIEQGIEQSKKEIVLSMKEKGLDISLISEIVKLDEKKIEKILNDKAA